MDRRKFAQDGLVSLWVCNPTIEASLTPAEKNEFLFRMGETRRRKSISRKVKKAIAATQSRCALFAVSFFEKQEILLKEVTTPRQKIVDEGRSADAKNLSYLEEKKGDQPKNRCILWVAGVNEYLYNYKVRPTK